MPNTYLLWKITARNFFENMTKKLEISTVTQMPVLMVVLRSVAEEEKAFALGIQFVIFRLFGYIPSPILFGNVIDSTCLLWKSTCEGEAGGRCLLYDIEAFRYK